MQKEAVEVIGYFGLTMLLLCVVPQVIKVIREGHADGLSLGYLLIGEIGMVSLLIYVVISTAAIPLLINYAYNTTAFGLMLWYKLRPRRRPHT